MFRGRVNNNYNNVTSLRQCLMALLTKSISNYFKSCTLIKQYVFSSTLDGNVFCYNWCFQYIFEQINFCVGRFVCRASMRNVAKAGKRIYFESGCHRRAQPVYCTYKNDTRDVSYVHAPALSPSGAKGRCAGSVNA